MKLGIVLIIAGIFLHLMSIPYLTGYSHRAGYLASLPYMKITLKDKQAEHDARWQFFPPEAKALYETRYPKAAKNVELRYKHIIAVTMLLILSLIHISEPTRPY